MNPITGERLVEINGGKYTLRFTWKALAEIEAKYGDNPNLFNAEVIANIASYGLSEKHPEMTAEKIMELSPPLMPFVNAVQEALQWAYFGKEPVPKSDVKKKKTGLLRRILSLFSAA